MDVAASEAAPSPARHAAAAPAPRRFAVVLNSAAGALVGRADPEKTVAAAFAAQGLAAEFIPRDAGDLPTRVGLARDSGAEAVVAIGGDGTVACAAQVLVGSGVRLGLLPSGTMNLLAKDLGLPIGDLDAAVRVLAAGVARPVDVGEVDGHVFLCAAMMGLPTRLARHREAGRGGAVLRLWSRFARAAIRALSHSRPMRLDLLVDGQARRVRTASLTVSVNLLGEGGDRQFGRTRLDGGRLGIYLFRRLRLSDVARVALSALLGHWHRDPAVDVLDAEALTVSARRPALRVMLDGEARLLATPLDFRLRPGGLLVLAPPAREKTVA